MNIKYIANVRIPTSKAQGYAVMKMCSEFVRHNVDLELYIPYKSSSDNKTDPFIFYGIQDRFEIVRIKSLDFLGKTYRFGKIFYWIDTLSFFLSMRLKIKFLKDDIIYTRDFITILFFGSKNFICLELHSIPKFKILFNFLVKKVDRFIVLNNNIKNYLIAMGIKSDSILVAQSGVDVNDFKDHSYTENIKDSFLNGYILGYVGALNTMGMEKGVLSGITALSLLPNEYKFLIVGGEEDEIKYYQKISSNLKVSDRVLFVGKIKHNEVSKYISVCNVLIAPFPENKHFSYFMSPLKIFEYMASKKPIITTNLPSLKEVLTDQENAILITPNDPKALAEAVIKLKGNPELSKKITDQAYKDVSEKYTWGIRVGKIISFIKPQ